MVVDVFEGLLLELGKILGTKLHADKHQSCLLKMKDGVKVQIELDHTGTLLVMGTDLGEIPPGRYRENLFKEALRANGLPNPRNGIFAYSNQNKHLVMFEMMPLKDLTGDKINEMLTPFTAKAKSWKESISRSEVPVVHIPGAPIVSKGMFGITP